MRVGDLKLPLAIAAMIFIGLVFVNAGTRDATVTKETAPPEASAPSEEPEGCSDGHIRESCETSIDTLYELCGIEVILEDKHISRDHAVEYCVDSGLWYCLELRIQGGHCYYEYEEGCNRVNHGCDDGYTSPDARCRGYVTYLLWQCNVYCTEGKYSSYENVCDCEDACG
jgi:hypothetical protein